MAEPVTFGAKLRAFRDAAGMTQEELATSVGITPLSLLRYENNQRIPRWDDVVRLAKVLGVTPDAFLGDDDQPDPDDDPDRPDGKAK